jgi:DNA replication protein DnaC
VTPLCSCQSIVKRNEGLEALEKLRLKEIAEDTLGVNPKIKNCTFDNFVPREGVMTALSYSKSYSKNISENIKNGYGILFLGEVGTGKSHLSAAISNVALDNEFTVIYEVITDLLCKIRSTYSSEDAKHKETNEQALLDSLCCCDLLVLDDIGTEKTSPWTETIIYTIVNKRYNLKKPTIVSTNLSLKELSKKIGVRTMDRLIEMNKMIELNCESYRRKIARERVMEEY